jgi:hypothetical protein
MRGHRDLVAWQKGMQLVKEIYRITAISLVRKCMG